MTLQEADEALSRLLKATIRQEGLTANRDKEVAAIQERYADKLTAASVEIATRTAELATFLEENPPADGAKSVQLWHGVIGMRTATTPSLVPLDEKWNWAKIEARLRRVFKTRFFHKPKPPAIDKVKVKRELTSEQLEKCGLKLETSETFYVELNRLADAA